MKRSHWTETLIDFWWVVYWNLVLLYQNEGGGEEEILDKVIFEAWLRWLEQCWFMPALDVKAFYLNVLLLNSPLTFYWNVPVGQMDLSSLYPYRKLHSQNPVFM